MRAKKVLALLLSALLIFGVMPMTVFAAQQDYFPLENFEGGGVGAVSYTHLTLPTICSV